jgi:trans-2,3-dihydro-3-hydroxyanthranilate isomerase
MRLPFFTLDVFTDHAFGGNPLGVFPDAAHLPPELMQQIAREMNLSESVFLGPPEAGGAARVRIFTPGVEVPFAGHPTVGTAIFLASRLDLAPNEGTATLVLEENVGPVPVEIRFEGGAPVFARFTTAVLPEHHPLAFTCGELASMVNLGEGDVCGDLQPEVVSCGLPYSIIPVRTVEALRRAVLDMAAWKRMLADTADHHVYLVCPADVGEGLDVRVRMFAPGSGVPEDPATGSAAAALGGYLAKADGRSEGVLSWVVGQGVEVGRPSTLYVEAERLGGETSAVRVGGSAVFVSEGSMTVPG